jgi:hypothetical protein
MKVDYLRYKDMADALYQLLQVPKTIPIKHTDVWNLIKPTCLEHRWVQCSIQNNGKDSPTPESRYET